MNYFSRRAGFFLPVLIAVFLTCPVIAGPSAPRGGESPAVQSPGAYVNDFAGVLDAETVGKLNGVLAELDAKAKAQVAVLTVKSLGGADLETYATETFKKWGIGNRQTNRGVLLLVAVEDHKSRVEVGYGLEGILPDGLTGAIQDKYIIPYFRNGDYAGGIYQGALAIASVIAKDSGTGLTAAPVESEPQNAVPLGAGQIIFCFILIVLFIIFAIRHPFLAFFLLNSMNSRGSGGFGGGGFGGFGGGMSGGGGSSRSW
ncbi:MAG: TPM domain-containing protein [Elusimicrobia bacterium]|nr:TPM domain-containing protein [Elusimicrobiota bacterium]